jgi:hypothetical protein
MPDWMLQVVTIAIGGATSGAAIYAAIRADLARLHEKAEHAIKSATEAHARIDGMLLRRMGDVK